MDDLLEQLGVMVEARFSTGGAPLLTRARHRSAVEDCVGCLRRFDPWAEVELAAEDLRLAARALGRIGGRVEVDEVLDVIFHEFCIGK